MTTISASVRFALATVCALALIGAYAFSVQAATVEVVSGDTAAGENQPGWLFNRDASTATPFEFNTDAASIGSGSLYVLPIGANASDKFIGEYFPGVLMADLESFSYDFLIGSGGDASDEHHFYLNVYANFGESDNNKFYDCRYNVVPTTGSTASFTTVTFDPTVAYPVTTRGGASASPYPCPAVPSDMDLLSSESNIRAFAINVGDTAAGDVGLDGYLDNVVIVTNDMLTFDFEPEPAQPLSKDDCKKGGYEAYGFKNQGQCIRFVETGKDSR